MKKLFRFKYELCNGTCYQYDDIFYSELKGLSLEARVSLVGVVTKAHDKLCDNPEYYFGLDKCEKTDLFVGHFRQPTRLDLFSSANLSDVINEMASFVINTDIPQLIGECKFGNNGDENLSEIILSACAA